MSEVKNDDAWVKTNEAARICGVNSWRITILTQEGIIASRKDPRDMRVVLVNLGQVKRHFGVE